MLKHCFHCADIGDICEQITANNHEIRFLADLNRSGFIAYTQVGSAPAG